MLEIMEGCRVDVCLMCISLCPSSTVIEGVRRGCWERMAGPGQVDPVRFQPCTPLIIWFSLLYGVPPGLLLESFLFSSFLLPKTSSRPVASLQRSRRRAGDCGAARKQDLCGTNEAGTRRGEQCVPTLPFFWSLSPRPAPHRFHTFKPFRRKSALDLVLERHSSLSSQRALSLPTFRRSLER